MTRARDELTVSWATAREPGGRSNRGSSPFLAPLLDGVPGISPPSDASAASATARRCTAASAASALSNSREKKTGRCADCPASYDEALFERLREWRLARASDDSVPAFVIFTDATLQLIAEHVPADERGLRAISGVGPEQDRQVRRRGARPGGRRHGAADGLGPRRLRGRSGRRVWEDFHVIPIKSFAPDDGQGLAFLSQQPRAWDR